MGRAPTDTKQRLIDTAMDLIWRNSYGAVSVDEICKTAGVQKGSFYHYFPSKADLAIVTMETCYEEHSGEHNEIFSPVIPPLERFDRLADHILREQVEAAEKYGRVCGCPFATLGSELAGQEEAIRLKIEDICRKYLMYLENALRDSAAGGHIPADTNIPAKAEEIYAYIMGQMMMARILNSLACLEENLKSGLRHIIGAAKGGT